MTIEIPEPMHTRILEIVQRYRDDIGEFHHLANSLVSLFGHRTLVPLIHSMKFRVKEPAHLEDKLVRKYRQAVISGSDFDITAENVYERINDLVGIRLLHLHTKQFEEINKALLELMAEEMYELVEPARARYWDNEYKSYFESIPIAVEANPRLYTSVHYVVKPNKRTTRTAEIQVRTLAEELWGEVDHAINYPSQAQDTAVREQLLVLARVTSSCTRLVDSIFSCIAANDRPSDTSDDASQSR